MGADWEVLTWADYGQAVREVTAGLVESGIEPGEHVGILSNNRVEWHVADLGILANGSVTVPLYQTSSAEQVAYILGHAEARVCFVENHDLLAKILEVSDELPKLDRVVVFENDDHPDPFDDPFVMSFADLRASGAARLEREPGPVRRPGRRGFAGQRGNPRLHERHDRSAQGHDDHPRQHHVDDSQRRVSCSRSARASGCCRSSR